MSKRRGHNEGSISRRKSDGRWVAMVNLGIVDGKRKRRAFSAKSRDEVAAWLNDILHAQKRGLPVGLDRQTTAAYLARWLETKRAEVRPNTHRRYTQYIQAASASELGQIQLAKLGPEDVQRLLNWRLEAGQSPRTVHHLRAVLRTALGQAEAWGLVPRNVARLTKPPRAERVEMRTLDGDQTAALLEAARGDPLEGIVALAVTTGMRQGELLALRWRDVDLDARAVQVRNTLTWADGGPVFAQPKTPKSRRQITLTRLAVDALREHRKRQIEERFRMGTTWNDDDLVFPNGIGRPADPSNLLKCFRALLARAGAPRIRFHDLRHTCATLSLLKGVPIKVVSEMLGHASVAITMDTYSHVLPSMQLAAADALDALLAR